MFPSAAGFVQALGRLDTNGQRPFAFGVSVVVPSYRRFSSSEEGAFDDITLGAVRQGYHRVFEDQTLWAGIGGAMRVQGRFSFGAGIFLMHRSVQDAASSFVAGQLVDGQYRTYRSAMMDLNFFNDGLVAVGGVKIKLSDRFFFGASARTPSITVYSTGNMRFARSSADAADPDGAGFLPTPTDVAVESETRINGEVRAGLAYVIPKRLTLAADVSIHLPVSYTLISVDDEQARAALLIPPEIKRGFVINGNLGGEVTFLDRFSIGLGFFTDFSSAPAIPDGDALRSSLSDVNMFGGSATFGIASEHTVTRLGVMYTYGAGEDVIAINSVQQLTLDQQSFVKVDLSQYYLYFFVSSTFKY
jgi:hypothetical protein